MININRYRWLIAVAGVTLFVVGSAASAQSSGLPSPSRSMYKCTMDNIVTYTDEPCLGAQRLDVIPTRGLNKYSGKERTGTDVANERRREMFAEAIKPLTGMNPQQFAVQTQRYNLSASAKAECAQLDVRTVKSEADERNANTTTKPAIERALLAQRKKFKDLRC